ncbi:MAG: hypothetical protein U1E45_00735 [Geminicoccaceae bacterium]
MSVFDRVADLFRGKAISVPPLDGVWKPDTSLDEAPALAACAQADNLVESAGRVLCSSLGAVVELAAAGPRPLFSFERPVSSLAALPDGGLAIGLDDGCILVRGGTYDGLDLSNADASCPVAMAVEAPGTLLVAHGSAGHRPGDWARSLMEKDASGSVWRYDLASKSAVCLARDLAYPFGVLPRPDGSCIVAEAWKHRLITIPAGGAASARTALASLPGYPSRMAAGPDGSIWLALFAPRNRLVEFVLREDAYRRDMVREVEREHWIAPSLGGTHSFLQPLQCGGVRTMGVHKAWSPSRSYGLLARLDADLRPVASFHSRADGSRHGITSVLPLWDRVLATSKGAGVVLELPTP